MEHNIHRTMESARQLLTSIIRSVIPVRRALPQPGLGEADLNVGVIWESFASGDDDPSEAPLGFGHFLQVQQASSQIEAAPMPACSARDNMVPFPAPALQAFFSRAA